MVHNDRTVDHNWAVHEERNDGRVADFVHRRRIVIKQGADTVVEFPMTVGVAGALIAPWLAAAGAIAALITDCSIEVERVGEAPAETTADRPAA